MNLHAVAKNYGSLTPEERFRLMLAASGRGDEAERNRLANASGRIVVSQQDFVPFALAFTELSFLTFIELVENAALLMNVFDITTDEANDALLRELLREGKSFLDLQQVGSFSLRTKADGWKLFCERMNVPPFLLWEALPGWERLERALALAEKTTFTAEGVVRCLNTVLPAGEPEMTTAMLITAGSLADAQEVRYRHRAEWLGAPT